MTKLVRIYAGDDGQSHFDEIEIPMNDTPDLGQVSDAIKAKELHFRNKKGVHDGDWHCVKGKQLVILIDGTLDVEVGDGSKHHFKSGDVFFCEDLTGQGHKVFGVDRKTIVIRLE